MKPETSVMDVEEYVQTQETDAETSVEETSVMDALGVSEKEEETNAGRWMGARFDLHSEQGKKDWDDIMAGLGIPRNKGAKYENAKFKEVVLNLSASLKSKEVKIVKA